MDALVADIGGTNTRCAVASAAAAIGPVSVFSNHDFGGLEPLLAGYLATLPAANRPQVAALCVAAPMQGDAVRMPNIDWQFSRRALQRTLGLRSLRVVNDFAALARSLPALTAADLAALGGGPPQPGAPKVVLGPGTGLGVASLVPVTGGWRVIPGEGGHCTLGAADDTDAEVMRQARARFGHCSAERLLSGAGLSFIHHALHGGAELAPAEIGRRFEAGDGPARQAFAEFFNLLGTMAGNVALILGAFGGVYIGGGIVPRYRAAFLASSFRERFERKGRYRDYLRAIPAWLITDEYPALKGLAALVREPEAADG